MNAIANRWTREGNLVIPDPVKLERKLPLYFRHQHYSSFQRQLNNFGFNKQHKSASPLNSVYVRIKGEQLADVDVVELLHLRPVLDSLDATAPALPACGHRIHASCLAGAEGSLVSHAWADSHTRTRKGQKVLCPTCRTPSWVAPL